MTICRVIGGFVLLIGGGMTIFAIVNIFDPATGKDSFFATSIAILLSSLLWFAIAQVIESLARIAHNTTIRPAGSP